MSSPLAGERAHEGTMSRATSVREGRALMPGALLETRGLTVRFGGLDSIPGIILGACLLIPLPERFRFLHEYRLFLYGVAIVLMLLFRPRGLWPATVRRYGLRESAGSFGVAGGGE